MINQVLLQGEIKKITISEPKETKKSKGASAVILLAYGPEREMTGNAVEFVHACQIRIPSYKFPPLRDKLRQGQFVDVYARVQGVFKTYGDQGMLTIEIVAEHIDIVRFGPHAAQNGAAPQRDPKPAAAEPADDSEPAAPAAAAEAVA